MFSVTILTIHQGFPAQCHVVEENSLSLGRDEKRFPQEMRDPAKPATLVSFFHTLWVVTTNALINGYCCPQKQDVAGLCLLL